MYFPPLYLSQNGFHFHAKRFSHALGKRVSLTHSHTQKSRGVRAQGAELVLVGLHQGTRETRGVRFFINLLTLAT